MSRNDSEILQDGSADKVAPLKMGPVNTETTVPEPKTGDGRKPTLLPKE